MGAAPIGCSPSRVNPMGQRQKGQYESTPVCTWAQDPFQLYKMGRVRLCLVREKVWVLIL